MVSSLTWLGSCRLIINSWNWCVLRKLKVATFHQWETAYNQSSWSVSSVSSGNFNLILVGFSLRRSSLEIVFHPECFSKLFVKLKRLAYIIRTSLNPPPMLLGSHANDSVWNGNANLMTINFQLRYNTELLRPLSFGS